MNFSLFFELDTKSRQSNVYAPPINLPANAGADLIKGNYNEFHFPIIFQQSSGKIFNDLLDVEYPGLYLISDKLINILKENNLTGWKTFPVQLYDKKGVEIFGYHGFSVIGTCSAITYDKSQTIQKQVVTNKPARTYYKGIFFSRWDGNDFFTPDKSNHIFMTKKAADLMKKNKITNLKMENLAEILTWDYIVNLDMGIKP